MFHFMKKDKKDEKKKEKKEKKEKDKKDKQREPMSQDEMKRLDEVKKGVFRRFSDRDKSKTKHSFKGGATNEEQMGVPRDSSDSSISSTGRPSPSRETAPDDSRRYDLNNPQSPPKRGDGDVKVKPAVQPRGILKSKSQRNERAVAQNLDDSRVLAENTVRNALDAHLLNGSQDKTPSQPPESPTPTREHDKTHKSKLKLPAIVPIQAPRIRELVLNRQPAGDFGFTLRKAILTEKSSGEGHHTVSRQTVIFAEPGSGMRSAQTGLIPGDKLIEVNGQNVENVTREEIVDIIRSSRDSVTVKVQPIQELIELSVRPAQDGGTIEVMEEMVKGGTLKRSGSFRHKKGVSQCIIINFTVKLLISDMSIY